MTEKELVSEVARIVALIGHVSYRQDIRKTQEQQMTDLMNLLHAVHRDAYNEAIKFACLYLEEHRLELPGRESEWSQLIIRKLATLKRQEEA